MIDMKTSPARLSKHYNENCTMDWMWMKARVHMIRLRLHKQAKQKKLCSQRDGAD